MALSRSKTINISCKKNYTNYNKGSIREIIMDGTELKKKRAEHQVSQTDVAKYLGYEVNGKPNRSMIARFENGHANINPRISLLLESYFKDHINGNNK